MAEDQHTCPRRAETGMDNPGSPFVGAGTNLDTWRTAGGLVGQENAGLSCSYCGSLHPDRFMELVREGWTVGPTDKSYKVYLSRTRTAEEVAQAKAAWLERDSTARALRNLGEERGKSAEEIAADLDRQWDQVPHDAAGTEAKFYLQHLSSEQRSEFIELHNSHRMKIGIPGHFYVPPFFTRPAAQ